MAKVKFLDGRVWKKFSDLTSIISTFFSLALIWVDIPKENKLLLGGVFLICLLILYVGIWCRFNKLQHIELNVEGSIVTIKSGDIFSEKGLKAIAFNEYFDTIVDDKIISRSSLNGKFISGHLNSTLDEFDKHISSYAFEEEEILDRNMQRLNGKIQRYKIGTMCVYNDYLITAFSKFDTADRANLTMPEYLEFLLKFWDKVNKVYAQRSVSVPIFGSGITRIKEHKNITDEELLKIMLWTFRISEMRFKYPARLTIIIHESKMASINLLDIKGARNGL